MTWVKISRTCEMAHALIRGSCDGSEQEEKAAWEAKGGPQQI